MNDALRLSLGVKSDPIEYRYSFEWLFRIMADEGVTRMQLGSFFELYQLPDAFFLELARKAEDFGITIASTFTAHRELGGFFRTETGFEAVARRNFERAIEVGALVGASSVGSNPGAVLRDRPGEKDAGIACYLRHLRELMTYGKDHGLRCLTIEPMSCAAEPPTLPGEIAHMGDTLQAHHDAHPDTTVPALFCADVSHGYADRDGTVVYSHVDLFEATLPYLCEVHLKNTDALFNATFGFSEEERERGIVDVAAFAGLLKRHEAALPAKDITGYLEIGGPKLGRDYSDHRLEESLRASLAWLREQWVLPGAAPEPAPKPVALSGVDAAKPAVRIAPSVMCADQCHLQDGVAKLEAAGADILHIDLMDAHFTPNMPLGLEMIKALRPVTQMPFDVHLMVDDNDLFVDLLAPLGVQMVSVHVESSVHFDRTLTRIRDKGMQAGAALNPHTPPEILRYVLDRLDFVLVMTVNPGYAGQKLVPAGIEKIAACRRFLDGHGCHIPIEVDGNVSFQHIPAMVGAGADILVAGTSSLYNAEGSLRQNTERTRQAIREGLALRNANDHAR